MRRRTATTLLALAVLAGATTVARAQDLPPVPEDPTAPAPGGPLDQNLDYRGDDFVPGASEQTDSDPAPYAKDDSRGWEQIAGAEYPGGGNDGTEPVDGSFTSFADDLFTVSFNATDRGFAGGSTCLNPPSREDFSTPEDYGREVKGCDRGPVIYRFNDPIDGDGEWKRASVENDDEAGYIGAIAWISPNKAVAVGGTGEYPRREAAREDGESYEDWVARDPAGRGRAWIYDPENKGDDEWHELELDEQNAPCSEPTDRTCGMRGMTALDFQRGVSPEFGFAGALGQIWEWDGANLAFTDRLDRGAPPDEMTNASLLSYRVRAIGFVTGQEAAQAFAATAGCCGAGPDEGGPRLLEYVEERPEDAQHNRPPSWAASRAAETQQDPAAPDSYYSLLVAPSGRYSSSAPSMVASAGGPERDGEPASMVTAGCADGDETANSLVRATLSTARLVAGDGDTHSAQFGTTTDGANTLAGRPSTGIGGCIPSGFNKAVIGDGIPDWAVGELRSTRKPGLGARALLYTTIGPTLAPETINITPGRVSDGTKYSEWYDQKHITDSPTTYEATSPEKLEEYRKSRFFLLPSYSLNAIEMVGDTGVGWTVGDHGAVLGIGGDGSGGAAGNEPQPPPLRPGPGEDLPGGSYAELGPEVPPGGAGLLPGLAAQRLEELERPELVAAGFADPTGHPAESVKQIVMSRDGSEGWAIGPARPVSTDQRLTLFHFQGGTWTRCDPTGIVGLVPPDRACAAVGPLLSWLAGTTRQRVRLIDATRVPLENDSDPSNDDEFEVVAIGTTYAATPDAPQRAVVLIYRDGRWRVQDSAARDVLTDGNLLGVAFTAPDDGWILGPHAGTSATNHKLFHFDGVRWSDCSTVPGCSDGRTVFAENNDGKDTVKGIVGVGDRVYLYGSRSGSDGAPWPMVIWHERGGSGWHGSVDGGDGSYDPGFDAGGDGLPDGERSQRGYVDSLALARDTDGRYGGWAVGGFGDGGVDVPVTLQHFGAPETTLARLEEGGDWRPYPDTGPLHDYLLPSLQGKPGQGQTVQRKFVSRELQVTLPPGDDGDGSALIAQQQTGRIFEFDPEKGRWGLLSEAGRFLTGEGEIQGDVRAMAPDGQGGAWVAIRNSQSNQSLPGTAGGYDYFFHYTARPPAAVFTEAPNPFEESSALLTSLQGAPDGTLWAGTNDGTLYRYDRIAGWTRTRVPDWDPGRVVTNPTGINAVAVGESGAAIAVGNGGRIADLSLEEVRLDRSSGTTLCAVSAGGPCSTGWNLRAAAVAPDGSAMVGGDSMALLSRSGASGDFRAITRPAAGSGTTITGISMPAADRAYLATDSGAIYAGQMMGEGAWSWRLENLGPDGQILTEDFPNHPLPLNSIAMGADSSGRDNGYAVGPAGVILERSGSGERPWRRLDTPYRDELTSVAIGAGADGALIGGAGGVILTAEGDRIEVARPAEYWGAPPESLSPDYPRVPSTPVVGLALLPGVEAGQTEAWAGVKGHTRSRGTDRLFHYSSAPGEPLLDPSARSVPLPDSPPARAGELSIAAFGKSECLEIASDHGRAVCLEPQGTTNANEVVLRRIVEAISNDAADAPDLALYTGDAVDTGGKPAQAITEATATGVVEANSLTARDLNGPLKLRSFAGLYSQPLADAGVPLLGAIGGQDVSEASKCVDALGAGCPGTRSVDLSAGDNLAWRQAFAAMPAPWGTGEPVDGDVAIQPIPDSPGSLRESDLPIVEDPTDIGLDTDVKLDGASTHYAADVSREGSDDPVARVIVLDSSLGSPTTSDPVQQPFERQLDWLDRMTCFRDQGVGCTREPEQAAIVVSNAPTYSYGPGALNETDTNAALVEQHLISGRVNLLVSGKLGWNGLYYTCAPQLHTPAPDGDYPTHPPEDFAECAGQEDSPGLPLEPPDPNELLGEAGATGIVPSVIAASAGGKFNQQAERAGSATAPDGYWRGYTQIRLDPAGDYRDVIVEQRPILDWIRLLGSSHELRARKSMQLEGIGRGPMGIRSRGWASDRDFALVLEALAPHYELSSPAITHRYDLLVADPEQPWLPKEGAADDDCDPYDCLPSNVGTVDRQSGAVKAGNGNYPRTFAIAQLSVGEMAATYPIVFQPRASFSPPVPPPPRPAALPPPPANPVQPPQPTPPAVDALVPPVLPTLTAAQPPVPPVPPTPPPAEPQTPLDLNLAPSALDVNPPTAVSQPPTPPVNPAPPSGARREARQRQAAAQKSGADSAEEGSEMQDAGGDLADSPRAPEGAQMTRHDFTALAHREQPSAWARGALIGGGLGIAALILAFGFRTARPTPRRREPELPAPAWGNNRSHRRR